MIENEREGEDSGKKRIQFQHLQEIIRFAFFYACDFFLWIIFFKLNFLTLYFYIYSIKRDNLSLNLILGQ
jgi:hypothetical protein